MNNMVAFMMEGWKTLDNPKENFDWGNIARFTTVDFITELLHFKGISPTAYLTKNYVFSTVEGDSLRKYMIDKSIDGAVLQIVIYNWTLGGWLWGTKHYRNPLKILIDTISKYGYSSLIFTLIYI